MKVLSELNCNLTNSNDSITKLSLLKGINAKEKISINFMNKQTNFTYSTTGFSQYLSVHFC